MASKKCRPCASKLWEMPAQRISWNSRFLLSPALETASMTLVWFLVLSVLASLQFRLLPTDCILKPFPFCENIIISMSPAWDKEKVWVSSRFQTYDLLGGHRFECGWGLRLFLCPVFLTCWLFYFHIYFTELKIYHLSFFHHFLFCCSCKYVPSFLWLFQSVCYTACQWIIWHWCQYGIMGKGQSRVCHCWCFL